MSDEKKQPPGGHDSTPLHPSSNPTYTVKITFHSASNIPVSDFNDGSSDPYVLAQIKTDRPTRHKEDPPLRFRSHALRRTTEPKWNASWVVAGIPSSGLTLNTRLYDEDPGDHDDRLGKVEFSTGRIDEGFKGFSQKEFEVSKKGADVRAYALRWCTAMTHKDRHVHAKLVLSIELVGKTEEEVGKAYTINNFYRIHYSPLIGRLAGTKASGDTGVEQYDFQANEIQLRGPVPNEMYHRYVDFKNFVGGMFKGTGLRGRILHKALHHQHQQIYNYTGRSKQGVFEGPGRDMTLQFLKMTHFDQGGRIFTYVITLDGLFRFTETGKEFGIDLLSKHTMHSDVNIYIAWSGEFLIRRLAHPDQDAEDPNQRTHPADELSGGPPSDAPPEDPKYYELVIDNDSGTYRPDEKLLPVLRKFLEKNFPGLQILAKSCTDKELDKIKEEQKKTKGKEGERRVYGQGSDSGSISSSDEEDLEDRAQGKMPKGALGKGVGLVEDPKGMAKELFKGGKQEREQAEERDDGMAEKQRGENDGA